MHIKKIALVVMISLILDLSSSLYAQKETVDNCSLPEILKRMHFVVYHNDYQAANNISWKAEYYYKRILRHFNVEDFHPWEKDKKCTIYIFESKDSFIKEADAPEWSDGLARYNPPRLYVYKGSRNLIKNILPHEITHLIFSEFMDRNEIPLWLNEGMAQYEEEKWDKGYSKRYLKNHIRRGIYIKLDELFNMKDYPKDEEERYLFYLQSASIIDYLRKEQIASLFGEFLTKIKEGKSVEDALKQTYQWKFQGGIPDLEERWIKYIKTRY